MIFLETYVVLKAVYGSLVNAEAGKPKDDNSPTRIAPGEEQPTTQVETSEHANKKKKGNRKPVVESSDKKEDAASDVNADDATTKSPENKRKKGDRTEADAGERSRKKTKIIERKKIDRIGKGHSKQVKTETNEVKPNDAENSEKTGDEKPKKTEVEKTRRRKMKKPSNPENEIEQNKNKDKKNKKNKDRTNQLIKNLNKWKNKGQLPKPDKSESNPEKTDKQPKVYITKIDKVNNEKDAKINKETKGDEKKSQETTVNTETETGGESNNE